ncbi:LbetaH domain-containing protein [Tautonia plasticadhaerens]|uniref:Acyl-[acyl-carrier-protein]--UDP-N-acetylglucosamine O-acyltransferase n=1 Tax=Tautonia plasticadhaerens TaxID=2527974 RepID=A0A518H8X2_9BACT|nr:acyl-ACP--UDP-N-acetylglucosamine O-acyltransferase [Tautonia plasticadhaerens]QDV37290.1 Acyl-[acyl-carrier-protein]--UDP-N-acetylglucosamine O-acyltransferase [Tautonia plasticadhaerens]
MAMQVADTATVDPKAELADEVEIGPYCVVGPGVRIGRGTRLIAHVCMLGPTRVGDRNVFAPFSVIGAEHGDAAHGGRVEIGDENAIREGSSIEAGSGPEGVTRIGSRNRLGPHVAIARDAWIDDEVSLGSGVRLGPMAGVEAFALVTAGVDVHPAATIGEHGFAGGPARICRDVPRYMLVDGSPSRVRCINLIGLRRRGFTRASIRALREAHRLLYRAKLDPNQAALRLVDHGMMTPEIIRLLESLHAQSSGRHGRARDARLRDGEEDRLVA